MIKRIFFIAVAIIAVFFLTNSFLEKKTTTKNTETNECAPIEKAREFQSQPYYNGKLIDAHVHMPVSSTIVGFVGRQLGFEGMPAFGGNLTMNYVNCLFQSEGITQSIGFFLPTKFSLSQEISAVKNSEKKYAGAIAPFLMPAPYSALRITIKEVRDTLDKNKGLFKGIGEIKVFDGTNLDNPYFTELFQIASEYNLPVMMHPYQKDKATVEKILRQYPNVNFLLHGGDDREWITDLMAEYKNVYRSIDADTTFLYGYKPEHQQGKGITKEEWLAYIRENFETRLNNELDFWKPKIEAYPDRFMWGTDRWYSWHFDFEVGGLLEEFGRSFIGKLDPTVREKFAYENAERLLSSSKQKAE